MEDREFSLRLAYHGCKFDYVKENLLSYRRHKTNKTKTTIYVVNGAKENISIMTRLFERPDLSNEIKTLRSKVFANIYLDSAAQAYGNNLGDIGNEWLEKALTEDPGLMVGEPPKWVVSLIGFALGTLVDDWEFYIRYVSKNFTQNEYLMKWSFIDLASHAYAAQSYIMQTQKKYTFAQKYAIKAIKMNLKLLLNRGLVKTALGFH